MLYNKPYGAPGSNDPYINGDPSIGRAGSIPPAEAVEYPQREIVNLITDAALLTPSNADLHQLSKAVQSGQLNFDHDTGTANNYAANMSPDPGSYFEGLYVVLKILNSNTGASVLNLNSHGNAPVLRTDGSPVIGNDIIIGTYVCFLFDGTSFRTVWSSAVAGTPVWLTGPRDFYVNFTTGNDTWDGTSATFVSGVKGPFKNVQRAASEYPKYNLNGYNITIHVADGSYAKMACPPGNGSGQIVWVGNHSTPGNVLITAAAVGGSAVTLSSAGAPQSFDGFAFASGGPIANDPGFGIWAAGGANVILAACSFSTSNTAFIACSEASVSINGPIIMQSSAGSALDCDGGRIILNGTTPPLLTFAAGTPMSIGFVVGVNASRIVGPWGTITNIGNCTGKKYDVSGNSVLNTFGQGVGAWPGSVAGSVATGGQAF